MARQLLIHIGYHKTATSWLQSRVFTSENGYAQLASHQQVDTEILRPHPLVFTPASASERIAERLASCPSDSAAVISSEILSGHPFYGGYESVETARRLKLIAPDACILITIRNQLRLLPSLYMQYLRRGGTLRPATFFDGTTEPGYRGFDPVHFDYNLLISHYRETFGAENVHVVTQESLASARDETLAELAEFAGNKQWKPLERYSAKPVAVSYPEGAAFLFRRINSLQKSTLNPEPVLSLGTTPFGLYRAVGYLARKAPFRTFIGRGTPVRSHVETRFAGRFAEGNRALARMYPSLDLTGYDGIA